MLDSKREVFADAGDRMEYNGPQTVYVLPLLYPDTEISNLRRFHRGRFESLEGGGVGPVCGYASR